MEEIFDRVYVGGDADYAKAVLKDGWSVLRCCKYGQGGHQQILGYRTTAAPKGPHYLWAKQGDRLLALNMLDLDDPNFIDPKMIGTGLKFIKDRLEAGDKVLIACNQGRSRGPSMGMMFLRMIGELPYDYFHSDRIYKTLYPNFTPGIGMRQFVRTHWNALGGSHTLRRGAYMKSMEAKREGDAT